MGRAREGRVEGSMALKSGMKRVRPGSEDGMEGGSQGSSSSLDGKAWRAGRGRERTGEGGEQTSRADRHISGSSPPPKACISLSCCQKLSGSLVVKTGPNPGE